MKPFLPVAGILLVSTLLSPQAARGEGPGKGRRAAAVAVWRLEASPEAVADAVRAVLCDRERELLACYGSLPDDGEPVTQVNLSFVLRASGSTSRPRAQPWDDRLDVVGAAFLDCVEERVASWTFARPDAAAPVEVGLTFSRRGAPAGAAISPLGSIGAEALRKVLDEHAGEIRLCYRQALARNGRLQGKVTLRWIVRADGSVLDPAVDEAGTTLLDGAVRECMIARVRGWSFPRPRDGRVAVIANPWVFRAHPE